MRLLFLATLCILIDISFVHQQTSKRHTSQKLIKIRECLTWQERGHPWSAKIVALPVTRGEWWNAKRGVGGRPSNADPCRGRSSKTYAFYHLQLHTSSAPSVVPILNYHCCSEVPLEEHHIYPLLTMNDTLPPATKRESLVSLQRRFEQVPKKKNWNLHKATIKQLYFNEGKTLNKVMAIMKERGFVAS